MACSWVRQPRSTSSPVRARRDGQARAPRPGADHCHAADRRQPAQPLPLEHHARPDPVGDRRGQRLGGILDDREAQRAPGAQPHLVGTDAPSAADRLGAEHGHRDDRDAGLQSEPADATLGLAERAGSHARALGEDEDDVAAGEDRLGGIDHVGVAGPPVDRERAQRVEDPRLPGTAEELLLGHVVHRSARHAGDHERIQEAAVIGGDDHRPVLGDVLEPDPSHPEVDPEERLEGQPDKPVDDRVGSVLPGALMKAIVIHRTLAYPSKRRPLQCSRR